MTFCWNRETSSSVRVFMQADYQVTTRIDLDGNVKLPFIGSLNLSGSTVRAAQTLIADRLRAGGYYRNPEVTIQVVDTVNGTVTVTGDVRMTVPVATERTLKEVLLIAGGLPATASHTVKIVRPGLPDPIVVDLGTDLASSTTANIPVHPHDIIQITRASVVYVLGAFGHQGAVPLDQSSPLTLLQLAALSGGVTFEGKFDDLRIIRTIGNDRKVVDVDIKKVREGKANDPVLQANDIVFLPTNAMKATLKSIGAGGVLGIVSILIAAHAGSRDGTRKRLAHLAAHHQERESWMTLEPEQSHPCARRRVRLAYLVSHPIQYQAPLLRRIAQEPDIDLTVLFGSDFSLKGYQDQGFGVGVKWDIPLVDGYKHVFLPTLRDGQDVSFAMPLNRGIVRELRGSGGAPGFDVLWVHGYATANAMHGIVAAKALGIPVLVRAESWLRDRGRSGVKLTLKQAFFAGLQRMVDGVLPIGTLNAEYWSHYFGDKIPQFLMPYAVDNAYFSQLAQKAKGGRAALQAELGLDPSRPVILFASKLQSRKNCAHLVEAYSRLSPGPGLEPAPYLVIVGDGEERAALERQAAATGFGSIRFCGFRNQSELPAFFDLSTVFVLPSRHEPWGLIVNEVMNAARPAIVSDDVGCAPDLIEDGVNGCIYPMGDVTALANALQRVLDTPGVAGEMGQRAFQRIQRWSFAEDIVGMRHALAAVAPGFQA